MEGVAIRPVPVAALVDLADVEFRAGRYRAADAVARLALSYAPDERALHRLLLSERRANETEPDISLHLALGEAFALLDKTEEAEAKFRAALALNLDLPQAYIGLSRMRMPGEGYLSWLKHIHVAMRPETYVEIGVNRGQSLALAEPPTRAIGIDPTPSISLKLPTEPVIFRETSDEFFDGGRLDRFLGGEQLRLGFIDGLHLFEQALKDFTHLSRYCGPRSALLFHDTLPFDELTQRRERQTKFHTGDVWKMVLWLKEYRPYLDIFTIATFWSGLTVVTGFDANPRGPEGEDDETIARFVALPFSEIETRIARSLNVVANDWRAVAERLAARGVL